MAEAHLEFLEATNSAKSFGDFEEIWIKMGEELEMEGLAKRPSTPTPESVENLNVRLDNTEEGASHDQESPSSLETPVQIYSPAMDSNWPLATKIDEEPLDSFENAENSILTTFRRKNPEKYNLLEKKLREPLAEQFKILRDLGDRVSKDMEQMSIIVNYLEDQLAPVPPKKKESEIHNFVILTLTMTSRPCYELCKTVNIH